MKSILIWSKADRTNGCGHIKRQLVLSDELLSRGYQVAFETPESTPGHNLVLERASERPGLLVNEHNVLHDLIIIDVEHGPTREELEICRTKFPETVVVGGVGFPMADQAAIDELVDLQIYQSVAVNEGWTSARNALVGCEYLIIDPIYRKVRDNYEGGLHALVVMGGSDPHGITRSVVERVLSYRNGYDYDVMAVMGPAATLTQFPRGIQIVNAPHNLADVLDRSRFAISALGMTTYEAMCVGVPTASICWSDDHERTAVALEDLGATSNLGT